MSSTLYRLTPSWRVAYGDDGRHGSPFPASAWQLASGTRIRPAPSGRRGCDAARTSDGCFANWREPSREGPHPGVPWPTAAASSMRRIRLKTIPALDTWRGRATCLGGPLRRRTPLLCRVDCRRETKPPLEAGCPVPRPVARLRSAGDGSPSAAGGWSEYQVGLHRGRLA